MTSRERLLRMFAGKDIDRDPIWLLFPWHRFSAYVDVWNIPCYSRIMKRIVQGDADSFDRRSVDRGFLYNANPDICFESRVRKEDDRIINETIMHAPGITLNRYHSKGKQNTLVKYFVDDPQQLKLLMQIPYIAPKPDLEKLKIERAEFGDRGLFMLDLGDPLGPLYSLMSATDFSMATATDYELLLEFTDVMESRVLELYKYFLDNNAADCYFIVGSEFAGPPLVSPAKFTEMSVRYVKKICDMIREYGKLSIVHYHGNLYHVLDGMKQINPDGLHTIEAPPIGDCTLTQAREVLGKNMALIGNIQYDDLIRLPRDEIIRQVENACAEARGGKFILSPTAGPYEDYIDNHAVDNYLAFIDTGIRASRY